MVDDFVAAAGNGDLSVLKRLIEQGVEADAISQAHKTTALVAASGHGPIDAVEYLVSLGCDVNKLGRFSMTPLMNACDRGGAIGSQIAGLLIANGADVKTVRVADEMDTLCFAVKQCTPNVIRSLIIQGAPVDGPEQCEITPLMIAAQADNAPIIKELLALGADPGVKCKLEWAKERTALQIAEMEGRSRAIEALQG